MNKPFATTIALKGSCANGYVWYEDGVLLLVLRKVFISHLGIVNKPACLRILGLNKLKKEKLMDTDNRMVISRRKGVGQRREG